MPGAAITRWCTPRAAGAWATANWRRWPRSSRCRRRQSCASKRRRSSATLAKACRSSISPTCAPGKAVYGIDAHMPGMVYAVDRAVAGPRRDIASVRRPGNAQVQGRAADRRARSRHTAVCVPGAGGCCGDCRHHLGGAAGPPEAEGRVGPGRKRQLRIGGLQAVVAGDRAATAEGGAQRRRRRCRVRARRPDARGGVLRAASGACPNGAAGGRRRVQGWQGRGLGRDPESAGGAGDGGQRAGD